VFTRAQLGHGWLAAGEGAPEEAELIGVEAEPVPLEAAVLAEPPSSASAEPGPVVLEAGLAPDGLFAAALCDWSMGAPQMSQ
jgi:hypothetical protein